MIIISHFSYDLPFVNGFWEKLTDSCPAHKHVFRKEQIPSQ